MISKPASVSRFAVSFVLSTAVSIASGVAAGAAKSKGDGFRKAAIADARYGNAEREALLKKAYHLREDLDAVVFGQENATMILQAKVVQYLEGFPNRSGEPVMVNMIGLPGIGKSATIEFLKKSGFPIVEFDAQNYAGFSGRGEHTLEEDINTAFLIHKNQSPNSPLFVVIEELDKLVEKNATTQAESTSSAIGTLNTISSEGKIHGSSGRAVPVSNVMFITTMNLAPIEIEAFSEEVLQVKKSYYDFTIEDFEKFDAWIRNQPSARYKVLARMFRSNTVSRFGANTIILQPLGIGAYRRIIELQVARAILQNAGEKSSEKRLTVDVHPSVVEFLLKEAVFAPSGARETVSLSNSLIEQLIIYGSKVVGQDLRSTDRPRHIEIRYHEEQERLYMRVTERVLVRNSATELRDGAAIAFPITYDPATRMFLPPTNIANVKPARKNPRSEDSQSIKPVTKREVFAARFPVSQNLTAGLQEYVSSVLFGQSDAIATIAADFENYFGRQGPARKEPSSRAFAGFPGIGKSELFLLAAKATNLPVARVNMQAYSSDSSETVKQFSKDVEYAIAKAIAYSESKEGNKDGRYLLLIEELDKAFEISPDGKFVNRPIMAKIKDLLNDGRFEAPGDYRTTTIDARAAFVGVTMNFAVDLFGFEADPRLTSIDDVINAWKKLKSSPASIKNILGSMFLPDTVSRLMTQLSIMKPLDRPAYRRIVESQADRVKTERLLDGKQRNVAQIEIKTTPAYRRYLFSESVIPSEGARNTTKMSNIMISTDLEYVLARLPRSSKFSKEPLTVTFDYSEAKQVVRYRINLTNTPDEDPLRLSDRLIALKFPPTKLRGRMTEERMHTAAHEFGHAFTGVRFGTRFEHVVVVPSAAAAGYVKPNGRGSSASDLMAKINMILGSRAFERIFMSENPMSAESVLSISSGPSRDIQMATFDLYSMLFKLGMNPDGGTLDSNFNLGAGKYADFESMPNLLATKLGLILRDMEDQIVRDTLSEHPQDWYVEKIIELAHAGAMTESEFYKLVDRKLPPNNRLSVGSVNEYFRSIFERALIRPSRAERAAAKDRNGAANETAAERSARAMLQFSNLVRKHLGSQSEGNQTVRSCRDLFSAS